MLKIINKEIMPGASSQQSYFVMECPGPPPAPARTLLLMIYMIIEQHTAAEPGAPPSGLVGAPLLLLLLLPLYVFLWLYIYIYIYTHIHIHIYICICIYRKLCISYYMKLYHIYIYIHINFHFFEFLKKWKKIYINMLIYTESDTESHTIIQNSSS